MRRSLVNLIIGTAYIGILLILAMTVGFAGAASQQIITGKVKEVNTVGGNLLLETSKESSKNIALSPPLIQGVKPGDTIQLVIADWCEDASGKAQASQAEGPPRRML